MNGRIYDPKLGRFLQADSSIDGVTSTQGYNRYSYVHNNPLNAIDPSGHFSLRKYVGLIVAVIGTYICGLQCGQLGYAIIGASAGAAGAAANGGNILQGAVLGGISGAAFSGVAGADFSGLGAFAGAAKFASFGAVGGVTAVLAGGKFGHGFIAAGAGGTVGGKIGDIGGSGGGAIRTVARTILGGTISKLTGGKFANGAGAAAFAAVMPEGMSRVSEKGGATDTQGTSKGYRRINPDVDGDGVADITFVNDDPNGLSTDMAVGEELATMVEDVVRETGFDININSTNRGTSCTSNHCYQNAVDINRINGMRVDNPATLGNATTLQDAFQAHSGIRENYGPAYNLKTTSSGIIDKSSNAYIVRKHRNHLHASGAW